MQVSNLPPRGHCSALRPRACCLAGRAGKASPQVLRLPGLGEAGADGDVLCLAPARRNIFITRHGVLGALLSAALCWRLLAQASREGCDLPPSYLFTFVSQEEWQFARSGSA